MSEFRDGYIDVYRADMLAMLDLAEELPLINEPKVVIEGKLINSEDIAIQVSGRPLAELDPESAEGVQARGGTAKGMIGLHGFGGRATMSLFFLN